MRAITIAALVMLVIAGAGFVLTKDLPAPEPAASSEPSDAEPDDFAAALESANDEAAAQRDAEPAPSRLSSGRTFYQWVDDSGAVRFARSLADVPPEWRARAGRIDVDDDKVQRAGRPTPKRTAARPRPRSAAQAPTRSALHDVTIYTAPWCGWCRKTIAYLDERGVDYVNKDVDEDPDHKAELREKSGGTSIPVVEIDGTLIRGYSPPQMAALLE
jgi:glutaredoxin